MVPEPLRKYVPGAPEFIPYTKELPKDTTSHKAKGKQQPPKPKPTEEATKKMEGLNM
jgi:seryl-tRNA synthetase